MDARWIFPHISGIGAYTRELIREFAADSCGARFLLLFDNATVSRRTLDETGAKSAPHMEVRMLPFGVFSAANQVRLPFILKEERCDVYHSTNYMIPLAHRRGRPGAPAYVATIHDVIPMLFPDHAPHARKTRLMPVFRGVMRRVGRCADLILTVSHRSRLDILDRLRMPAADADRVRAIHNGVTAGFDRRDAAPRRLPAPGATRRLLYVGRADPYKNAGLLIHCLADLRTSLPFPVELVMVGPRDPRYPDAENLARQLGVAEHVRWMNYLTQDELAATYTGCDVLVHPSRYEGFGLQILEAMASGLPVVCTDGGALPEVAGEAALIVPVDNRQALLDSIRRVLTEKGLAENLAVKGREQAAKFRWRASAERTMQAYRDARAGMQAPRS